MVGCRRRLMERHVSGRVVGNCADKRLTVETYRFADDGVVRTPRPCRSSSIAAPWPKAAIAPRHASSCSQHGWPDAWRNGIYPHHHYRSTAHEVPRITAGSARVRLGGEGGQTVELRAGDVVAIPVGIALKRESASADLLVIGAYPCGQRPNL